MDISRIDCRVRDARQRFSERDRNMVIVTEVRKGNISHLTPHLFSDDLPRSLVANTIDIVARDLAEVMAPLPTLDCASGNGLTAADKRRAERKNRIGSYYWKKSRLQREMFRLADYYLSFGLGVFYVDPDFDHQCPLIRVEDPRGFYYGKDRWGCLRWTAKIWRAQVGEIVNLFPEHEAKIMGPRHKRRSEMDMMELCRYDDMENGQVVYLPQCDNLVLAVSPQPTSRIPVVTVDRWGLEPIPRGQFDDIVWVQLAKAIMAQYTLSAADKSINAPVVLPKDVTQFAVGADAIISTDNPSGAGRLRLDVPQDVFLMGQQLDADLKEGSRYPDARLGGVQGSIVTGRGVEALLGTFDTQLKTAQTLFKTGLEDVTSICFEMDVKLWPNKSEKITGVETGRPYELTYVPRRDIGDNYECEVTYGFAAGMTPAQSMVALLQLRGDKLIGRDTARAQLPFQLDPEKEQRDIDQQDLSDALLQGIMAATQAMGPMIQAGMPVEGLLVATAKVIELRQKGKPLHEAVLEAFQPPEPEEPEDLALPAEPGAGEAELAPGVRDNGLLQGVAYGQQGMAPGGMPTIQSLIAGLRRRPGGEMEPTMSAELLRKRATGVG